MEKSYNKFQLSKMFGNNREYQVVIRTDDAQELIDALKQIKPFIQGIEGEILGNEAHANPGITTLCAVHNASMTEAISKKTGKPYFSHRVDGKMCFGKGVL